MMSNFSIKYFDDFYDSYSYFMEQKGLSPPIIFDREYLRSLRGIHFGYDNKRESSIQLGFFMNTGVWLHYMDYFFFCKDSPLAKGCKHKGSDFISTKSFKPRKMWLLPPLVVRYKTNKVDFVSGSSIFDFPVPYLESNYNNNYIDCQYICNATTFTRFMLANKKLTGVENMDYEAFPIVVRRFNNYNAKIADLYIHSSYNRAYPGFRNRRLPTAFNLEAYLFRKNKMYCNIFAIQRNGELVAILLWGENFKYINVHYIITRKESEVNKELIPFAWHLILYEFCKRLPRDTMLNLGGCGCSQELQQNLSNTAYQDYYLVPTRPDVLIKGHAHQVFITPEMEKITVDKDSYLSIEKFMPSIPYNNYMKKGRSACAIYRMFQSCGKGSNFREAKSKFIRLVSIHNSKLVRKGLEARTAKTYTHFLAQTEKERNFASKKMYSSGKLKKIDSSRWIWLRKPK